jgi:hypothetical protein
MNCMKIALINQEELISCILISDYDVEIDEDILKRAITTQMFKLIRFIWTYEKNYVVENGIQRPISYQYLFNLVQKILEDKAEEKIMDIASWNLNTKGENMLLSLLK